MHLKQHIINHRSTVTCLYHRNWLHGCIPIHTQHSDHWKWRLTACILVGKNQHQFSTQSRQCFDNASWGTGKTSSPKKLYFWFVDGDNLTSSGSSLAPIKSRKKTFWYQLTQVRLEKYVKMRIFNTEWQLLNLQLEHLIVNWFIINQIKF